MSTKRVLLVLLFAAIGCTREPQPTGSAAGPTTAAEEHRKSNREQQEFLVIGHVIGMQNERVSQTLKRAGIDCIVQGDEFHEILVPKLRQHEAIGILAKDAREAGYEITWSTQ